MGTGKPGDWYGLTIGVMIVCTVAILGLFCWLRSAHHYKNDIQKVQH